MGQNSLLICMNSAQRLPSKIYPSFQNIEIWWGGRSNFIVDKLDKDCLARLSGSTSKAINHVDYMYT